MNSDISISILHYTWDETQYQPMRKKLIKNAGHSCCQPVVPFGFAAASADFDAVIFPCPTPKLTDI